MPEPIAPERALRLLIDAVRPTEVIEVDLARAQDRVLAEAVRADRDFPPTDRASMDGFAVRVEDTLAPGRTLEVVGEVRAGQPAKDLSVGPGQAVRIMTGAVVPPGADAVVMVERTEEQRETRRVVLLEGVTRGQNIRRRGEDCRSGEIVLEPGMPIHAPEIATLASVGSTRLRVFRRPVAHVLATGDEIVEPDRPPLEHQVRNSNAITLQAQLRELGVRARYLGIAPDEATRLGPLLEAGLAGDLLLVTGGVSAGEYDLVADALSRTGMRLLFHKVAIKPGKPILAGVRDGCLVVGLPGNPVSTYTAFAVFVAPAVRRMTGLRLWDNAQVEVVLEEPLHQRPGRQGYHPARVRAVAGGLVARPVRITGSGDVLALSQANAFVVAPADCEHADAGTRLEAVLWKDFQLRSGESRRAGA